MAPFGDSACALLPLSTCITERIQSAGIENRRDASSTNESTDSIGASEPTDGAAGDVCAITGVQNRIENPSANTPTKTEKRRWQKTPDV
jgi:hypothetical protein